MMTIFPRRGSAVVLAVALLCSTAPMALARTPAKPAFNVLQAVRDDFTADFGAKPLKGVDVNARDEYGAPALSWAVTRSAPIALQQLLDAGANPNLVDVDGVSSLSLAVEGKQPAMVQALLSKGADVNIARTSGETPLMTAARLGLADVVGMLLAKGADPNARENKFGQTALMWGAGKPEVVRQLIAKGADLKAADKSWDVTSVYYTPSIVTLGSTGIPWANKGEFKVKVGGETALIAAARAGSLESARLMIEAGADVNQAAADGTTALHAALYTWRQAAARPVRAPRVKAPKGAAEAAAGGNAAKRQIAESALGNLAEPIPIDNDGLRFRPNLDLATLLLDHGAKANVADGAGFTPLHGAIFAANPAFAGQGGRFSRSGLGALPPRVAPYENEAFPVIQRLLEGGADPNRGTKWPTSGPVNNVRLSPASPGSTAMHVAAQVNSPAILALLGQYHGDPNQVRDDGHSALSLAARNNSIEAMRVMAERGADFTKTYDPTDEIADPVVVKTVQRRKQTLLHIAAVAGAAECIPYLVAKGVPLDARNAQGETAFELADQQEVFRHKARYEGGVGVVDPSAVRETRTTDAIKAIASPNARRRMTMMAYTLVAQAQ